MREVWIAVLAETGHVAISTMPSIKHKVEHNLVSMSDREKDCNPEGTATGKQSSPDDGAEPLTMQREEYRLYPDTKH